MSGHTNPEEIIGCIGFDTLNIPPVETVIEKRIFLKIKTLMSIITCQCVEFRRFIVALGRSSHKSSKERGAVTFTLHEDGFDETLRKIQKCYEIFNDPGYKDIEDSVKFNLMNNALPFNAYYHLDEKHLKTENNVNLYKTYNPNKSSIIFIGMTASDSDYLYSYINIITV